MKILIEVSARHVHLSEDDFARLFGDQQLTNKQKLSQQDDYATEETVEILGPKGKLPRVRLISPFRKDTQVEISVTDAIGLGLECPLKLSGDLPGTEIEIVGPKGTIKAKAAIIAKRHLHLPPSLAKELNLSTRQHVSVKTNGERSLIFDNVAVRVAEGYTPAVHLDTDEANAALISKQADGELIL